MILFNLMETFITQSKVFAEQRKSYSNVYQSMQRHQKNNQDLQIKEKKEHVTDVPMTHEKLFEIGKDLDNQYKTTKVTPLDYYYRLGVSQKLLSFDVPECFKEYNRSVYKSSNIYDKEEHRRMKSLEHSKNTASQNCKDAYYMCLNEIMKHKIEIYDVDIKLSNFQNRSMSACCGSMNVFTFYCKKNHYEFEVRFDDDCDCYPGILIVDCVTDIQTNQKINIRCDLFCESASKLKLENFLQLLNSDNYDDYIQKRFGHYFRLPQLLRLYGIDVIAPEILIRDEETCMDRNHIGDNLDNLFEITYNDQKCLLMLRYHHLSETNNYGLCICPIIDNTKITERDCYLPNSYRYMTNLPIIKYDSDEDIHNLVASLEKYFARKKGQYGFFENNKYYNENHICDYIKKNFNDERKLIINKKGINVLDGPELDIFMILKPSENEINKYGALTYDRITNIEYPYDYYGIHFYYDKETDPNNCVLTIEGKYHDLVKVANDFYTNQEEFNEETYKPNVIDIGEMFEFKGTLSECFKQMIDFLDSFSDIINEPVQY